MRSNKPLSLLLLLITALLSIPAGSAFAWDKETCQSALKEIDSTVENVEKNSDLLNFIPHDYYSEAVINIRIARNEMEKEEYEVAFFYISIARIKLKTAEVYAESKKLQRDKLVLERNYYRDRKQESRCTQADSSSNLNSIIEAKLQKKGNTYRIEILDRDLFKKSGFNFRKKGLKTMAGIIKVLRNYENCKIRVVGHTSSDDYKHFSERKSKRVKQFLEENSINEDRIKTIAAGNEIPLNTAVGFRRIDRVELIITGIR